MAETASTSMAASNSFGPVSVVQPKAQHSHTHTAILLHGRGSTGKEFMQELLETECSGGISVADHLPGWRLVFPSSPRLWSAAFEEELPAWFEAYSLADPTLRQDLQTSGLQASVAYISGVIDDEVLRLGSADRVVLGGISQGGAVALWTLLCSQDPERPIGALFGASTWLPFAGRIAEYLCGRDKAPDGGRDADAFVDSMMSRLREFVASPSVSNPRSLLSTPVFLGHGVDDAYVDLELGVQARDVLQKVGLEVQWKEYSGAEQEGHWFKAPEELDDIVRFLQVLAAPGSAAP